jgi:hypothetical protein
MTSTSGAARLDQLRGNPAPVAPSTSEPNLNPTINEQPPLMELDEDLDNKDPSHITELNKFNVYWQYPCIPKIAVVQMSPVVMLLLHHVNLTWALERIGIASCTTYTSSYENDTLRKSLRRATI